MASLSEHARAMRKEMSQDQDDVTQIRVDNHPVGIMGLRRVLEETADEFGDRFDEEVAEKLLARLGKLNYISEGAKENYKKAFLREYKRHRGRETGDDPHCELQVRILGQGCAQCDKMAREVLAILSESGMAGDFRHVQDIREIGKYGVMGMPALVINGKVKCAGRMPTRGQMLAWLKEAAKESDQ
jgi:hypothetical protein